MIVLRKISRTNTIYLTKDLVGAMDGVNKVFNTQDHFNSDNIYLSLNGQVLIKDIDFEITGSNEISFIYQAPEQEDVLSATYEVV